MATARNTIKNWFKKGLKPLEVQFAAWLDSFWHMDDAIPMSSIAGLEDALNSIEVGVAEGTVIFIGNCDLSTNEFPEEGGTGAGGVIAKGNQFYNTAPSTTLLGRDGGPIGADVLIQALDHEPGQDETKWAVIITQA